MSYTLEDRQYLAERYGVQVPIDRKRANVATVRTADPMTLQDAQALRKRVMAYLPDNYRAQLDLDVRHGHGAMTVVIVGHDVAGWTLEGYVLPRLASGLIFAEASVVAE